MDPLSHPTSVALKALTQQLFPELYQQRRLELEEEGCLVPNGDSNRPARMTLPLFTLHVSVFPGESFPMFIFEPRYVLMLQRCLQSSRCFGIISPNSLTSEHGIGTVLRIESCSSAGMQRHMIVTSAMHRFKVQSYHEGADGYLVGILETVHDENSLTNSDGSTVRNEELDILIELLQKAVPTRSQAILRSRSEIGSQSYYEKQGMLLSSVLVRDFAKRQELLELTDSEIRIRRLVEIVEQSTRKMSKS
eukprot:CAMPEP_0182448424 /NCGR_PEP_ID=MMETSP1172-20130603/26856_1 /TAXON_ID=708627 /ORGANISM="Timspurckia oligopyrenoides, Strain CCMP3278" /LENGTH=248 /DNA_ID=CAMNT_0024645289 /DNA_START=353 /DNA_END=1095 /DNA_ORIENTATION=-